MDLIKLKVRIIEQYRTQHRFAVCCGKREQWISRIICGRQRPTEQEKNLICTKLRIQNPEEYFEEI
jgi:hypothetical protein